MTENTMDASMMGGWLMSGSGSGFLFILVLLLAAAVTVKYLFFGGRRDG
jgi:hypothetical protein